MQQWYTFEKLVSVCQCHGIYLGHVIAVAKCFVVFEGHGGQGSPWIIINPTVRVVPSTQSVHNEVTQRYNQVHI